MRCDKKRLWYVPVLSDHFSTKFCLRLHALTSRTFSWLPTKAGLQTFLPSQAPSREFSMAFMLRSHNGVHCCGTVGDSHPSSQLSTAKCTFTGDSFQNHGAKIHFFFDTTKIFRKKCVPMHPIQALFLKKTNKLFLLFPSIPYVCKKWINSGIIWNFPKNSVYLQPENV